MELYEAMILLDSNAVIDNKECWDKTSAGITAVITKNGGKVEKIVKWGEDRKLSYEIKKHKRGGYALVHFTAPTASITAMEKDYKLVDFVLRVMILRDTDGIEAPEPSAATAVITSY